MTAKKGSGTTTKSGEVKVRRAGVLGIRRRNSVYVFLMEK